MIQSLRSVISRSFPRESKTYTLDDDAANTVTYECYGMILEDMSAQMKGPNVEKYRNTYLDLMIIEVTAKSFP